MSANGTMSFNISTLGKKWFNMKTHLSSIVSLISHEMAHDKAINHYDSAFYNDIEASAGIFTALALDQPDFFAPNADYNDLKYASYAPGE